MTFSIVAMDPETKTVGVCQGTGSIALASRCPQVGGGVAVTSQWHSDWRLGMRAHDLAKSGLDPEVILVALEKTDPLFHYRQVGIVLDDGRVAGHTGGFTGGQRFAGHRVGKGFTVLGNGIVGPEVLDAMFASFEGSAGTQFEERLMSALEAGLDAGGEGRTHLSSSMITGVRGERRPRVDLRVDIVSEGSDSIRDLRRIFNEYGPLMEYYSDYWLENPEVLGEEWIEMGSPRSQSVQLVS